MGSLMALVAFFENHHENVDQLWFSELHLPTEPAKDGYRVFEKLLDVRQDGC